MMPCFAIDGLVTPKKVILRGLWFGPKRPQRVVIWVHGLGSTLFNRMNIIERFADKKTAVLAFNNRGHDTIASIQTEGKKRIKAGAAHEVFTDCVDDIEGAINFARRAGVKQIYLAGHSTGCQKSIYWAYKKQGKGVKGIILLAPVSDYAAELKLQGAEKLARAAKAARALVANGKKHALLPAGLWHEVLDAQRFLSLYTPDSVEEIFSYAQAKKNPRIVRAIKTPILVLWAGADEFADRPSEKVAAWFEKTIRSKHKVVVIPNVGHGFKGGELRVVTEVKKFIGR